MAEESAVEIKQWLGLRHGYEMRLATIEEGTLRFLNQFCGFTNGPAVSTSFSPPSLGVASLDFQLGKIRVNFVDLCFRSDNVPEYFSMMAKMGVELYILPKKCDVCDLLPNYF